MDKWTPAHWLFAVPIGAMLWLALIALTVVLTGQALDLYEDWRRGRAYEKEQAAREKSEQAQALRAMLSPHKKESGEDV